MLLFNRKAYTLSQFILLWVLGVLLVVLVCVNVFRYRATSQARAAEAFMQEVRIEQEDRCAVGRKYAVYQNHLKAFSKQEDVTKSIRYDISNGHGITAHHKLLDFRLQMPSYADGRICCDNCKKINRYYPRCSVLKKRKDFVAVEPECMIYSPKKKQNTADSKNENDMPATQMDESSREPVEKLMNTTPDNAAEPAKQEGASSQEDPSSAPVPDASTSETQPKQEESASVLQPVTDQAVSTAQEKEPTDTKTVRAKKCSVPAQGEFFIDECEVYQPETTGSVIHTWNEEKCAYEITQSCVLPSRWQSVNKTKEEKGLYPSDLEDYCPQLLKSAPCGKEAAPGRECGTANAVCYKGCQITEQTEVKESSLVILYDVKVEIKQLRCMPAKEVTVSVP